MSVEVFLSYTREKEPAATKFWSLLQKQLHIRIGSNAEIFKDNEDIKLGDDWELALNAGLHSASAFLFLLSNQWLESKWCNNEYNTFKQGMSNHDKKLFPVEWATVTDTFLNEDQKRIYNEVRGAESYDFTQFFGQSLSSDKVGKAIAKLAAKITEHLALVRTRRPTN